MKVILCKYKDRLINLSSRNRSLVLKKIYKKRAFDLTHLNAFDENIDELIVSYICNREKDRLLLLEDPYELRIQETHNLDEEMKSEKDNLLSQVDTSDKQLFEQKNQDIARRFQEKYELGLNKIDRKVNKIINFSNSLTYLQREVAATEKETGLYELFIGYPFTEGKFQDNSFVKAPLLLFPVRIIKDNNKWYLENILDQDILINKVFVLGYAKYNEVKVKDFDTDFSSLEQFGDNLTENILSYFDDNKIKIQDTGIKHIEKFIDHSNQNLPEYKIGEIVLKNYLILGQFPISNSIYNDYQALERQELNGTLLDKLLQNDITNDAEKCEAKEEDGKLSFSERDVHFITPLDYSQENAVKKANDADQLVIYGPPGTGKSQTIANIIADALVKGKRVLMVSQKRAALDVIFNRLSAIQSKVLLLHDVNKDKKGFYEKVSDTLETFDNFENHADVSQKAKQIDNTIMQLENIAEILHKPRDFGITLQQMYSKSKAINTRADKRYEHFRAFRNEDWFKEFKYQELKEAVSRVHVEEVIKNYIELVHMISNNSLLTQLRSDFDLFKADDFCNRKDSIIKACQEGIYNLLEKGKGKRLIEIYKSKCFGVEKEDLANLIDKINSDENKELLKPLNNGRWWSLKYWLQFKQNKLKELENRTEFESRREKIEIEILDFNVKILNATKELQALNSVLEDNIASKLMMEFFNGANIVEKLNLIEQAIEKYDEYKRLNGIFSYLDILDKKILEYGYRHTKTVEDFSELIADTLEFAILNCINEIEKLPVENQCLPQLARFKELTESINKLMKEKNSLTPGLIVSTWNKKIAQYSESKIFREFKRQANKKRMLWPIRRYVSEFPEMALNLFPCWLLSPETVSDILPLKQGLFDVVIFDEASQMFIENAIPTVFRGRKAIVAGDDKQLKPNSSFKSKYEDEIEEEEISIESSAALEEQSLLDLAKVNFHSVHLNYHYRSRYDELINFSNYAFYRARLQVSPNIVNTSISSPPIERIKVKGQWNDRKNIAEAEEVVSLVSKIFKLRETNETMGIITFNVNQKDLIEDILEHRAYEDAQFRAQYVNEINRKDGNEDVSLFVKNIENVQGDERDIIIFSIGYAPDEKGRVSVNFGSLSQDGGENRLNVAISRARKRIYIVTSIEPEELNVEGSKNVGPKLFKKYLQYAREVSNKNTNEANAILYSLLDSGVDRPIDVKYDSDFEMEVRDALVAKGYRIDTQVGVSGYRIDLAVYNNETSRYILGIECDGAAYHSSKSARERDIHRQRYLESRGWKIIRIWSRDWWNNPEAEVKNIESYLTSLTNPTNP